MLWLTGGPGCSGLWSLLAQTGSCKVQSDLETERNPYSWTTRANVVWLDQPLSTGFPYGSMDQNTTANAQQVRENLYLILEGFFTRHPELIRRDLYIVGDGYAGHAILQIAHYIWKKN